MKVYQILWGVFGFLAVALGAFGAHGLKEILSPKYLTIYHTAVEYQFYHVMALGLTLVFYHLQPSKGLKWSALFFSLGILIFSGSLYTLALTQKSWLGAITPIGGLFFLLGWIFVIAVAFKQRDN